MDMSKLLTIDSTPNTSNALAGPSDPSTSNNNNNKRVSQTETPESGGEDAGSNAGRKKRKRNRLALSCTECKRRKIKCDRKSPCEACIRRGDEKKCHWEDARSEVVPQPFALATEHEQLKRRVAQLEAYIFKQGGIEFDPSLLGPDHHHATTAEVDELDEDSEGRDSDTEDAALVLEELALGRKFTRVGSRKRKNRSSLLSSESHYRIKDPNHDSEGVATPPTPLNDAIPLTANSRAIASLLVPVVDARRKLVMDDIWKSLPASKPVLDWLISNYFARADWAWHLHHTQTFNAEYEAFGQLLLQGRRDEIDPLWLAVLCMTLCLSVNCLDGPISSPLVNITQQDLETLPQRFFESAQSALECGDWTGTPRVRTLQTCALFAPYLLYQGNPSTGERHQTYLAAAIRICQRLGLHRLGSDPSVMPPDDPALPAGINSLRREVCLRLFRNLLFVEYISINKIKPGLPPQVIDSAFPGNYNDDDLPPEGLVLARPPDEATDTSFDLVKHRIALVQRSFNDVINGDAPLEYETIMTLDSGYREILENLPTRYLANYIPPLGEPLTSLWERNMALQTINSRLLRLHRPFMSRGYREEKYAPSTTAAIQAARNVLMTQMSLARAPLIKMGFQLLTIQGATVVLFMDIWTRWPEDVTESNDFRLIQEVVPFFERSLSSRHAAVQKIAQQSLNVISLLREALDSRRMASEARVASGGTWESDVEVEPYGRLLKRVGASISTTAAMGFDGAEAATGHIFSDRPHDFNRGASVPEQQQQPQEPQEMPPAPPTDWSNAMYGSPSGLNLGANPTNTEWPQAGLALDFNLDSISGPEYAVTGFNWNEWTAYDQFSALGNEF